VGSWAARFGFTATASLDDNPADLAGLFAKHGLEVTSVCAHANLLDASAPSRYGNAEVTKAIKLAHGMKVADVITTEGEPPYRVGARACPAGSRSSWWPKSSTSPVRLAAALGIRLLLEPHGPVTGTIDGLGEVLERLGHRGTVGRQP
jgi:inosose dehydratase